MDTNKETKTELENISPVVASISKKNVLTIENTFFKNFSKGLDLDRDSSVIIDNSNSYHLPENYFENFSSNIFNEIKIKQLSKKGTPVFFSRYAIAACITALLGINLFFYNFDKKYVSTYVSNKEDFLPTETFNTTEFENEFNNINDEDLLLYLQTKGVDIDAALVASLSEEKSNNH
jgi:hypothetical protein